MSKCKKCGKPAGFLTEICVSCQVEGNPASKAAAALAERAATVQLTTAFALAGHRIVRNIDVVTGEVAFGLGIMQGLATGLTEAFGGESDTTTSVLANARKTVLTRLRRAALDVGGNAVIAVALDYSEFSGGGKPILFLVASGTAVVVEAES